MIHKNCMKKTVIAVIAIILIIAGFVIFFKQDLSPKEEYGPYDKFIICLEKNDVKMYGNYASRESLMQMSLFLESLGLFEKSDVYVECNEYGPKSKTDKCIKEDITSYPTWTVNGKKYNGIQGLNKLSELTGCTYEN